MPTKRQIPYPYGIFFISFTCFRWNNLFEITSSYDLVYKWFDYLKSRGNYINAYVIMPNHLHILIGFRNNDKNLNKVIGDGKRFIGYEIINRLRFANEDKLLQQMQNVVNNADRQRGKLHEVWQDSFDWKECSSDEIIRQKINYIHNNPCKGKWKLSQNPESYVHSSAAYYLTGEQGIYPVTDFMQMQDIDLSKKSH
ncbi:MAG: hypothetical protein JST87_16570 [Bacteroidetes bacterium]|nr:hypothetical protein [Bacteroidota bacterium]